MAETHPVCLTSIVHCFLEGFYRQATDAALRYLKMYSNDPLLMLLKALGIVMEGRIEEAIRELQQLRDKPQLTLCSTIALLFAHKRRQSSDGDVVAELESSLRLSRRTAGDRALYYSAMSLWLLGHGVKAREYIDRMLLQARASPEGLILKGWVTLSSDDQGQRTKAIRYLDRGLQDSSNVFGLFGRSEYFFDKQNLSLAMEIANQIIASHPNFVPALVLKMRIFLALHDWEQTRDTAERILLHDHRSIRALQILSIYSAAKAGDLGKAKDFLQHLLCALEVTEPRTPAVHVCITAPISRLCASDPAALQMVTAALQRANSRTPGGAEVALELGQLLALQQKPREARRWFSAALGADRSCLAAAAGEIWCLLMEDQTREAEQQLEFLWEVQQSIGRSAELCLLQAQLALGGGHSQEAVLPLVREAAELHFLSLSGLPLGLEYLRKLDVSFLLRVLRVNLSYAQEQPQAAGQPLPFGLVNSHMILDALVKVCPGLPITAYHMAHVKFLMGDRGAAQTFLDVCMEGDHSMPEAHLLQARLHLQAGHAHQCLSGLELCISQNFQVRELPQYHLIRARAQRMACRLPDAIQSLRVAMSMPGVKRSLPDPAPPVSSSDRASVFLELAEALRLSGEQEATEMVQEAMLMFSGTQEEMRVVLARVDLALARHDVDAALSVLRDVSPGHPGYTQAREKMAHVFLDSQRDKTRYINCYREILDSLPGPHSCMLLGDAHMKIQEPEKAIIAYQDAMTLAPSDPTFAKKIGQAYVRIHEFDTAVGYYETAFSSFSAEDSLCLQLVELLIKLQHFAKAQKILEKALNQEDTTDLTAMMNRVEYLRVFVRVLQATNRPSEDPLEEAYSLQCRILRRVAVEMPEVAQVQNAVAVEMCQELACLFRLKQEPEAAGRWHSLALTHCPSSTEVLFQAAELLCAQGQLERCEEQCLSILKADEGHTPTAMLLADVWLQKKQPEDTIRMYTDIMTRSPGNFRALVKFLHVLRREARLHDILPFLKASETSCQAAAREPGYNYCQGAYYWHACRVSEALVHLNRARRDPDWGEDALELMVNICLNPDKATVGGELFQADPEEESDRGSLMGLNTAQNLLKEFRPQSTRGQERVALLHSICTIHGKEPKQLERTISVLTDMVSSTSDKCGPLLSMAQALMVLKRLPQARNQLKRLTKMEWTEQIAEPLEQAWLLTADIFIKSGKYDIARQHLDRCLQRNKSCSKAYEYKGFMLENEQSYADAAACYEQAWNHSCQTNPAIGFRLAFNYLKHKDCTQAVDVCRQVLTRYPDYPRIQTEVLQRAWLSLRP